MSLANLEGPNQHNLYVNTLTVGPLTTSLLTGALQVHGGASLSGNLNIGGIVDLSGDCTFTSTTQSTNYQTGAVVVDGGVGIAGNLNVNNDVHVNGSLYVPNLVYENVQIVTSTNDATDTLTGALQVYGGGGVQKSLYVGGPLHAVDDTDVSSTSVLTGSTQITGGCSIGKKLEVFDSIHTPTTNCTTCNSTTCNCTTLNATSISTTTSISCATLECTATTASVDQTTGALKVMGGVGVGGDINCSKIITHSNGDEIIINRANTGAQYKLSIDTSNDLYIQNSTPAAISQNIFLDSGNSGRIIISATTSSTNTNSGCLICQGGAAIKEKLYVANNITTNGSILADTIAKNVGTALNISADTPISVLNTTQSSDTLTGACIIDGGVVIKKNVFNSGAYVNNSNINSSNVASGSILLQGTSGMGVGGNINHGGIFKNINTTESTSSSTGSCILSGGVGIAKNLYVGGSTNVATDMTITGTLTSSSLLNGQQINAQSTTQSTDIYTGSLRCFGGCGIQKNCNIGGNMVVSGKISNNDNTQSTDISTGSIVSSGGIGVILNANIGGVTTIYDTTESSSIYTGAMVVNGGVGISKKLYVGNDIYSGAHYIDKPAPQITIQDSLSTSTISKWSESGSNLSLIRNIASVDYLFEKYIGSTLAVERYGQQQIKVTDDTISVTTGSLISSGGVGISKSLFLGGSTYNTIAELDITGAGPLNNLSLPNSSSIFFSGTITNNVHITGLVNHTGTNIEGQIINIYGYSASPVNVIIDNESASSTAENRIITTTGTDLTFALAPTISIILIYKGTLNRWLIFTN